MSVLAAGVAAVAAMPVEVPVAHQPIEGLFAARLEVGTPSQRIWASIDTGSPWLWVLNSPDGKLPGFRPKDSSGESTERGTIDSFTYADGVKISGTHISEKVRLGGVVLESGPMLLATNATLNGKPTDRIAGKSVASIGLNLRSDPPPRQQFRSRSFFLPDRFDDHKDSATTLKSFFKSFWAEHLEVPQTFFLSLGGPTPRMVIGADLENGPDASGLTFLADVFTRRSNLWYTSLRAIGFSMAPKADAGSGSGHLVWNLDFNQFMVEGAPARLDSGSKSIRVGHLIFERFIANLGDGRCRVNEEMGIDCPCNPAAIDEEFPWISLSFETFENARVLGLDMGSDMRVCIPPSAYVTPSGGIGTCRLAIVNAGLYQKFFGLEGVVLGVPFFKSVAVGMDLGRRRLALGPSLVSGFAPVGGATSGDTSQTQVPCPCADPKNWWNSGHRFSANRCSLVLFGTVVTLVYIFLVHSPIADGMRAQLGIGDSPAMPLPGMTTELPNRAANRGPEPDRPFVQMPGGPE